MSRVAATPEVIAARIRQHEQARADRDRIRMADAMQPADWRARQEAITGSGPAVTSGPSVPDVDGNAGAPRRAVDTLAAMHRRGSIDGVQLMAGRQFQDDFETGLRGSLFAPDPSRPVVDCSKVDRSENRTTAQLEAADRVFGVLKYLGSTFSTDGLRLPPAADVVWAVLGQGLTVKEWCARQPWIEEKRAAGMLAAMLTVMGAYYGFHERAEQVRTHGA